MDPHRDASILVRIDCEDPAFSELVIGRLARRSWTLQVYRGDSQTTPSIAVALLARPSAGAPIKIERALGSLTAAEWGRAFHLAASAIECTPEIDR